MFLSMMATRRSTSALHCGGTLPLSSPIQICFIPVSFPITHGWKGFFTALRFIIIDEMHAYRGVFGSHVANVIRRLKRISRFYGSQPQFILTSATIANPQELAEKLIEKPVTVIDQDGSPHGERHFLIYNPPLSRQKDGHSAKHPARRILPGR